MEAFRAADVHTQICLADARHSERTVGNGLPVARHSVYINAVGKVLECRAAGHGYTCETVHIPIRVVADIGHTAADIFGVNGILSLLECGNSTADFIQLDQML